VAISPLTASPNLSGFARPVPAAQPAAGVAAPRPTPQSPAIGGGSATSAIANQARQSIVERSKATVADTTPNAEEGGRPRPQIPDPPFTQSVGLYNNSTRVFVDIVLSGDQGRRVARVFGTPPAPAAAPAGGARPVNITA
jgi:hypothetical protein